MSERQLMIAPSRELGFELLYDGQRVFDLIDYATRVRLYDESLEQLNKDVTASSELLKDDADGLFGWCVTWDQFRTDDLVGVPYYYYTVFLVRHMQQSFGAQSLVANIRLPRPLLRYIESVLGVSVKPYKNAQANLREYMRRNGSPLRMLRSFLKQKNIVPPAKLPAKEDSYVFGQVDKNFKTNRYKGLLAELEHAKPMLFSRMLFDGINDLPEDIAQVDFYPFYSHKLLLNAVSRSRRLGRHMSRLSKQPGVNLMFALMAEQSLPQRTLMILRFELMLKALEYYQPRALFVVTAFADTISRLATAAAARMKVPVVMIAARPMYTSLRAEERSAKADWSGVNDAHVADHFIVRDAYSKQTFVKQGIDACLVFTQSLAGAVAAPKQHISTGLLVLFSHDPTMNELFIKTLENVEQHLFGTLYYRLHPLCKLSEQQHERLYKLGKNVTDSSGFPIFDIAMEDIIAVTINSTAAIEVSSRGAGLVWLPYHTERSLPFSEVMSAIGEVSYSDNMFGEILQRLHQADERQKLISETANSYNVNFKTESTYSELFRHLSL